MRTPEKSPQLDAAFRDRMRERSRIQYPFGKALARTQYFEAQRGLIEDRSRAPAVAPFAEANRTLRRTAAKLPVVKSAAYLSAARRHLLAPRPLEAAVDLPVWRELGPRRIPQGQTYGNGGNNKPAVSGRCNGLVVDAHDSRHLVLCSAGGGLWESVDTGQSWRPLSDFMGALSMGALVAAPGSPNILYAGTGEGDSQIPLGIGLLRSTDAGRTWAVLTNSTLAGLAIYGLCVAPTNPAQVWIASTGGLLESRDGGETVRRVLTGRCWSVQINSRNPAEMIACTESGAWRSVSGGNSWSSLGLGGLPPDARLVRLEVAFAPSSASIAYLAAATDSGAALWRRSVSGSSFQPQNVPARLNVQQAWYDWCLAVSPDNPDELYWGAIELYRGRRKAAGWQWQNISSRSVGDSIHPDQHHIAFDPNDPKVVFACNDGGVFRSSNRGIDWKSLNPGLGITEFEFIVHREGDANWILGGTQDNGTLRHGSHQIWDQVALGDGGDCAVVETPRACCYHSYYDMYIERAFLDGNSGLRWANVSPEIPENYANLFYPPMDASGPLLAKAGVSLWVSQDLGEHWEEVLFQGAYDSPAAPASLPRASAITILSPTSILVGTEAGTIYRIRRSSTSWANARIEPLKSPRRGSISDIATGGNATTLWASCSFITGNHVFRSMDNGQSWVNRSGNLPALPVNALVIDPKNSAHVYAATDHGVYQTVDAGASWRLFSNGLPHAIVGDLIFHEGTRKIRAGTRSRGVWEVTI